MIMLFCIDLRCKIKNFTWLRNPNHKFYGKYQLYVDFNIDLLEHFNYEITERYDFFIFISIFTFLKHINGCYLLNIQTNRKLLDISQITTILKQII
jgi:hypothetical protein